MWIHLLVPNSTAIIAVFMPMVIALAQSKGINPAVLALPERARLFQSHPCDGCGEVTAEHLLRLENGKKLCLDCFRAYNRFDV